MSVRGTDWVRGGIWISAEMFVTPGGRRTATGVLAMFSLLIASLIAS
jgi:hypothetical protein